MFETDESHRGGYGGWGLMAIFFILIIGIFAWAITNRLGYRDGYPNGYPAAACAPAYPAYGCGNGVPPYVAYEGQHISEQFGKVEQSILASNANLSKQIDQSEMTTLIESKNAQIADWREKFNAEHADKLQQETLNAVAAGDNKIEAMLAALVSRMVKVPDFNPAGGFAQSCLHPLGC